MAEAIEYYLLPQDIKPFKVQLQNVRLDSLENLYFCGKFLRLVQSINLRFDKRKPESYLVRDFERALSLASSLQELSLIVNSDNLLSSKIVRRITKSIRSKTFERLTINGIFTSKRELQKILSPLKGSIKEITLEAATFDDESFVDFLGYIQGNFSLDYICFKDIWEDNDDEGYEVLDRVELDKEDIGKGLSTLKFNILSTLLVRGQIES